MTRPYHTNNSARIIPIDNPARYADAILMSKIGMLLAEAQARPQLAQELVVLLGETIAECKMVELACVTGQLDLAGLVPADIA